ncbi:MAG: hypothetical protein QMB23_01225 [Candidatus Nanopelagicales bacterium]
MGWRSCAKLRQIYLFDTRPAPPQTDQNQLPPFSHGKILVSEPDSISPDISLRNDGAFNLS